MMRPPPPWPTTYDETRCKEVQPMHAVLDEDWADVAQAWMLQFLDEELLASWGKPDTSDNVYSDMATALAQPGHYSRAWTVRHSDRRANKVTGPDGLMIRCGYPSRMIYTERYAWGLGDYALHVQATAGDKVHFRPVSPDKLRVIGSHEDPSVPVELWELQWRFVPAFGGEMWCYDHYSIRPGREPFFRIEAAEEAVDPTDAGKRIEIYTDLTENILGTKDEPWEPYVGDGYPWKAEDGSPLIPYPILRTVDSGKTWNYTARHGAYRATLGICQISTYVMHAARDASGSMVLTWGLERPGANHERVGHDSASSRIIFSPGAVAFLTPKPGAETKVGVQEIGPGANLQMLTQYQHTYRQLAAQRFGVSDGQAIRNDANPTSASALLITEQARMSAIRSADPLFRRFDAEVMRVVSSVLRPFGVNVPESGYTFEYWHAPATPAEQRERRDQETYDVEQGYASAVEVYMARHPGIKRKEAIKALAQVRADQIALQREIARLEADDLGLSPVDAPRMLTLLETATGALEAPDLDRSVLASSLEQMADALGAGDETTPPKATTPQ